ncbi:MAG: hypothetical protein DWQ07_15155 [Chloroflexi bacterium]|nr:MAG: hypothetical protein DWQ07_15155 [Chloroflexota bacterium]MBL1196443.1 hypothetical protein [Chloroflexota bacterium]NOH13738.1 hypothetical protein [Chloroflexota bacterium]
MNEQISAAHRKLLNEYLDLSTMTLGTVGQDGQAHVAPVYFVADENIDLYFFSKPDSQHIQDLEGNPSAAISIYPECFDWQEIRGVQMQGSVGSNIPRKKEKQLIKLYSEKFPFVSGLKIAFTENRMYQFRPEWVRVVDNRVQFGHKTEFSLAAD